MVGFKTKIHITHIFTRTRIRHVFNLHALENSMNLVLLSVLFAILATSGMSVAYGYADLSPRAQMEGNIPAEHVACRDNLQLMIRNNGDAMCVSENTAQRLTDAGLAEMKAKSDGGAMYDMMMGAMLSVNNALDIYDQHGDEAFEIITALNMEDSYPFVITLDDAIEVADGSIMDRRGDKTWSDIELEAVMGSIRDIINAGDGAWITYVFLNPATGMDQAKTSWIVPRDGYIFGSGFYFEGYRADMVRSDWSIRNAIAAFDILGMDVAFEYITSMESTMASYPFVISPDGIVMAHGSTPSHVGDPSVIALSEQWDSVLAELDESGMAKAMYEFNNPATGQVEPKKTLLVLHDGYIFGSGFYKGSAMNAMPMLDLTAEEMAWLEDNNVIWQAYDPSWYPIEYINDMGKIDGLAAWYVEKIKEYVQINIRSIDGISSWADALQAGQEGNADVFMMMVDTNQRHEFLEFTKPHTSLETSMTTLGILDIDGSDLSGFEIATIRGDALESWLDDTHPDATYTSFDSALMALESVASGDTDMHIGAQVITSYIINNYDIQGLADSGPSEYMYHLSIGVQKDNPMLLSIMQKAIDAIPKDEKAAALKGLS